MSGNGRQMCPCQCHWDLSWLRFGDTRIAVTDVDGLFVAERHRQFLFIETKRIDEPLTQGQSIMLRELSRIKGVTVIVIYGDDSHPEYMRQFTDGELRGIEETSREDVQRRLDRWFAKAEGLLTTR